jgi:hypothetical protein
VRANIPPDDGNALSGELDEFARRPYSHIVLTRYEGDALHVYKNERRAWLMYLRDPADSGLYIQPAVPATAGSVEHFRCACGIDLEFSAAMCLPIGEAVAVVRAFFADGELPSKWTWGDSFE